ncbi:hypothetical protein ACA910_021033 [Epithemia clementina (nom. ined.)]
MSSNLGEEVCFVGGLYEGRTGWLDTMQAASEQKYAVVVDLGEGCHKATSVYKENVLLKISYRAPRCFEEALLEQHVDISKTLKKLVTQLAQCGLRQTDVLIMLIKMRLQRAINKQAQLGSKARWHHVDYKEPEASTSG